MGSTGLQNVTCTKHQYYGHLCPDFLTSTGILFFISEVSRLLLTIVSCVIRLLLIANVVPSSPILVTLMIEAIRFSETLVLTNATRHNIPEEGILQSHRRENLKSYINRESSVPNRNFSHLPPDHTITPYR
jgi:hypothetical protein